MLLRRERVAWFELAQLARRLLLTVVLSFVASANVYRDFLIVLLLVLLLTVHLR